MAQHDNGYHLLFAHPELVEDLLKNFVPEEWVNLLDFSKMVRVNTKFHSDALDKREGDLIFNIQYKEGPGEIYLYLLLEFQSRPDKWMALRILVYVGLLYQQLLKEKNINQSLLPPVFPLVLYNGDEQWHSAQDMRALIGLHSHSPLNKWQPQIHYYLLDEKQCTTDNNDSIVGTLFDIENINNINELQEKLRLLEQQVPSTRASLRRALTAWIYYVIAPHKGLQLVKKDMQDLSEVREMLSTRIKQWEQEIADKNLEQGIEQGMMHGQLLGKSKMLKHLLTLKFNILPGWAELQIDHANASQLDQWSHCLFTANNIEDIFK